MKSQRWKTIAYLPLLLVVVFVAGRTPDEYKSGIVWPEPAIVDPGDSVRAPSDAIVLFDGKNLDAFEGGDKWTIENGYAIVNETGLTSKQAFGDCQLHLEFATPAEVSGEGQGRGNSGLYLMGKYELQILDSYENKTYFDGQCAAFYKQQPPAVNASRGPGKWQTYDVIFEAPRFADDGTLIKPAYATVLHNGVVVHNHFELMGSTFFDRPPGYEKHEDKLPLHIQNHGNPLRFRNIWVRENIQPLVGQKPIQESGQAESPADITGAPSVQTPYVAGPAEMVAGCCAAVSSCCEPSRPRRPIFRRTCCCCPR